MTDRQRLAVYLELPYRLDADGYSVDRAFMMFVLAVGERFASVDLIGRVDPTPGRAPYAIPDHVVVSELPHYPSLRHIRAFVASTPKTLLRLWGAVGDVDVVWVLGPHPMSLPVAIIARLKGRRVVLGVRQHFPSYVRYRLPSRRWRPALAAAIALEAAFQTLGRWMPVTAVGSDLASRYGRHGRAVHEFAVSLVPDAALVDCPEVDLNADRPVELLSVGRLDAEKAPHLLIEMMDQLERDDPGRYRLTLVGTGPLQGEIERQAASRAGRVRLLGYVPFGSQLLDLYRASDLFVHVARTEGLPQVLVEAHSQGLPVVATDVGGVSAALNGGRAGLRVPPGDAGALASAVRTLSGDDELRQRLAMAGLALARTRTMEAETERLAEFLAGH
jgi:glycosyltransferase involved in cell wall biosynthesis